MAICTKLSTQFLSKVGISGKSNKLIFAAKTSLSAYSTTPVLQFHAIKPPSFASFHTSIKLRQQQHQQQTSTQTEKAQAKKEENTADTEAEEEAVTGETLDEKDIKRKELEDLLTKTKKESDDYKSQLAYALAERENVRRIAKQDVEKATSFGIQNFAKQLLEVADNLERCLNSVPKESVETNKDIGALIEGISMTERELHKAFKNNGLEKVVPAVGDKFDPNFMNALMQVKAQDKPHGTVAMVLKPAYLLKGRVIRAADTGVIYHPEEQQ